MRTLADRVHAMTYDVQSELIGARKLRQLGVVPSDRDVMRLRTLLRRARRFYLDDEMTAQAVRSSHASIDRLISRVHLARLPFDSMWLEYDCDVVVREGKRLGMLGEVIDPGTAGLRGVLLSRVRPDKPGSWMAHTFSEMPQLGGVYMSSLVMVLTDEPDTYPTQGTGDISPFTDTLSRAAWGAVLAHADSGEVVRRLGRLGSFLIDPVITSPAIRQGGELGGRMVELLQTEMSERAGDLRIVMTMLAMINVVPIRYVHVPATGGYSRRLRTLSYLDHHVVQIECGRARVERVVDCALRASERRVRWHEVRGHYVHRRSADPCLECARPRVLDDGARWEELSPGRHRCRTCGTRRTWREYPEGRGDSSIGLVRQEYEVSA